MGVSKKYVVYELNRVMESEKHQALERVEFRGFQSNRFDTEEDAIKALVKEKRTYIDFIIVPQICITGSNED